MSLPQKSQPSLAVLDQPCQNQRGWEAQKDFSSAVSFLMQISNTFFSSLPTLLVKNIGYRLQKQQQHLNPVTETHTE